MPNNADIVTELARRFVKRCDAMGYKGRKADHAALDFFCGAATAAELAGNESLAAQLTSTCVFNVSIRGMFGVRDLAKENVPEPVA